MNGGDDAMMRRYQSSMSRFSHPDPYDGSYDLANPQSLNRYAYVQNDPMNLTDPTGECQTTPDGQQVGICGQTPEIQQELDSQIADPNSALGSVEAQTVAQGVPVTVGYGATTPTGELTNGGKTEVSIAKTTKADGTVVAQSVTSATVTIDPNVTVSTSGINSRNGKAKNNVELTKKEIIEHEIGGHVAEELATGGRGVGEAAGIAAENAYRQKNGNSFRRTSDNVTIDNRRKMK